MKKINWLILGLMFVGSFLALPILPANIPMHWNYIGQVDNWMPKNQAVWVFPLLVTVMFASFELFPKFDPKKDKYVLFAPEWEMIKTGLLSFFAYLQFITFYIALHPEVKMIPLMFIGLGALFILLGNYLSKIRQNYFIGVRLPWTLASEENWNKTHRYASWCFVIAGITTLIEAYAIWYAPIIVLGSLLMAAILPMIYSFLLFKKQEKKMKWVYVGIVAIIIAAVGLRLTSGPEDTWICNQGQWVQHGHPNTPAPTEPCN